MYIEKGTGQVIVPEEEWTTIRLTPWQLKTLQNLVRKATPKGWDEKVMWGHILALKDLSNASECLQPGTDERDRAARTGEQYGDPLQRGQDVLPQQ